MLPVGLAPDGSPAQALHRRRLVERFFCAGAAYIKRQLAAFAQGLRHNDIYEQKRAIARQLTPDEMTAVAVFYGAEYRQLASKY